MTSFPVELEPRPQPRLAAVALLVHAAAAVLPWATRCPTWLAAALSLLAGAGLWATLVRVPGRHCPLQFLAFRDGAWRVGLAGAGPEETALIGAGTRIYADLIVLDVVACWRRLGWLLPRGALDPVQFRRLKVRLRLAC